MSSCVSMALPTKAPAAKGVGPRVQRKCAKAAAPVSEPPCALCQAEAAHAAGTPSSVPPLPLSTPPAAKGFEVGAPDDAFEREADRVAHQVVSSKPAAPAKPNAAAPKLQRLPASTPNVTHAPANVQQALASGGRPLDKSTRSFFEPRFGRDFSSVRVHADEAADRSARSLDAQAYTVGHHVVFSRGKYSSAAEGGKCLLAHELAHVVQQSRSPGSMPALQRKKGKGKGPGSCGYFNLAADVTIGSAAHVQIQQRLATRGITREFEIPRATKVKGLARRCQRLGIPAGYADVARVTGPVISLGEIKPYYIAKVLGRLEARHYQHRAVQSQQRITRLGGCGRRSGPGPDDWGFFYRVGAIGPATMFTLISGTITGDENFGAFSMDPKLDLIAQDVGSGAIGYWCRQNAAGKKETEDKKKKKPKGKGGGANLGLGVSLGGSSASAGNVGVSVSVDSNSAAAGTAGASIAISSDSATAGAAGASATKDTMSASAAVAGATAAKEGESVTAGAAGATKASGASSASAGVAGKANTEDSIGASAGQSGSSDTKDSVTASAGGSGTSKTEGVVGTSKGGSSKKPIDPKDVSGTDAEKTPDGDAEVAKGQGAGKGDGGKGGKDEKSDEESGSGGDKEAGGSGSGKGKNQSDVKGDGKGGGGTGGDKSAPGSDDKRGEGKGDGKGEGKGGKPGSGPGTGSSKGTGAASNPLGVYTVIPLGTSDAERERIAAEAAKVAVLVQKASEAQKELLRHLSSNSPDKRYLVPTSEWVQRMMNVTKGLSVDDIEYLKQLNWTPGKISEAELRQRIEKLLANRPKDPPKGEGGSMQAPDEPGGGGKGGTGKGAGAGAGQGKQKAGKGSDDDKSSGKGDPSGSSDRVIAPPKGSNRDTAGIFLFQILSGITRDGNPKPGKSVSCKVRINDLTTKKTFVLRGVDITFESSKETPLTINGVKFVNVKFNVFFTADFWSEKNKFYGKGGLELRTEVDMGRRKVKK